MIYRALILICFCISGCAETKTQDEIEWDRQMARENWRMCEQAYQRAGKTTYHAGHTHRRGQKTRIEHARSDLAMNGCRMILGPYWAD